MSTKRKPEPLEGAPSKKKKIRESKNRKKYWKKADITEVEDYLESKRQDERIGDVTLDKDKDFFYEEKSFGEEAEKRYHKKRSEILNEPLKCHGILQQFSKVPVPYSVDRQRTEDERKSVKHLEKEQMVLRKRVAQSSATVSKNKKLKDEQKSKTKCKTLNTETNIFDLWDEGPAEKASKKKTETGCHFDVLETPEDADCLTKDQLVYLAKTTRKTRPKMRPSRLKKPSMLPAVEVAKPGASYKPSNEDHQELLAEAHEVEVKKVKKEEHLERVLTSLFPTEEQAKQNRIKEKIQEAAGILYSDSDSEGEEEANGDISSVNPPVLAENRKTRVQRNRQKAHKERLKGAALKRSEKKLDKQFGRINVYKQEMKKAQKKTNKKIEERKQKEAEANFKPRKIGRQKFHAPEIEIKLSDEIPTSLRQLKPEGSLMLDRMRSFEKRNIIEPRRKTVRKKKWTKKVYKRNYKKGFEDLLTTPKADNVR